MSVVDVLASQYGWTMDYILDKVYPDEALELTRRIQTRTNSDYLLQLAIVSNPWSKDPKALVTELEQRIDREVGLGGDEPDHAGIERLKGRLASKSKNIRVK